MARAKVLHVYKDFDVYNGLIEILTILAAGTDHSRFELGVCVFRYGGNSFGDHFENLGGKIFSLDIPERRANQAREFLRLYTFFKSFRPDIVQTYALKANFYGILAARMAKVPLIIGSEMTLKDIAHNPMARLRDRLLQPLVGLSLRYSDAFMVTSESIKKEWYNRRYEGKYRVIYPPFNLEKYRAAQGGSVPAGARSMSRNPTIGFIGRLSEEKGLETLIQAMPVVRAAAPGSRLLIAGTGPMETRLKSMVRSAGLDGCISFVGFCSNAFEFMKGLDIFVLPSRTEGCPIVVLEAMAMGVPVVATDVGGTPELVEDNVTGLLVKSQSPDELAKSILLLLADRDRAERMGREGHQRAFGKFHPRTFIDAVENMYLELLEGKA